MQKTRTNFMTLADAIQIHSTKSRSPDDVHSQYAQWFVELKKLRNYVEKLEQEIKNDLDMNVETEQFISTDTYVGQTEQFYGLKIIYNGRPKYEVILKPDMWRIFYPNQRRIATNYRTVDEYSPQRIKNFIKADMGK